jgi:hypothetical protein
MLKGLQKVLYSLFIFMLIFKLDYDRILQVIYSMLIKTRENKFNFKNKRFLEKKEHTHQK